MGAADRGADSQGLMEKGKRMDGLFEKTETMGKNQ